MTEIDAMHARYRAARIEFDRANAALRDVRARLERVSRDIRGPVSAGGGPNELCPAWKPGISNWLDRLPDKAEVVATLDVFDAARRELLAAFDALPPEERSHVQPPPRHLMTGP